MKARKKDSNDEWKDVAFVQLEGSDILYKERYLEFKYDNLSTEIKTYNQDGEEKYWENVRIQAAISAMQAIINSDTLRNAKIEAAVNLEELPHKVIASSAIQFADALVKQLKGE